MATQWETSKRKYIPPPESYPETARKILAVDDDVQRLVNWYIGTDKRRKRLAMYYHSVQDACQEVYITLLSLDRKKLVRLARKYALSTIVLNQSRWTLLRLVGKRNRVVLHSPPSRVEHYVTDIDLDRSDLTKELNRSLSSLDYRTKEIVRLRYGLGDGYCYTLEETAYIFRVTRERIRQIEAKAIRKLQQPKHATRLQQFLPEHEESTVIEPPKPTDLRCDSCLSSDSVSAILSKSVWFFVCDECATAIEFRQASSQ